MSRQLQEAGHDQRAGSFFVYNYPTWLHVDSRLEIANCKLGLSNWKLQISNWTLQIGNYKCRRRRRVPTRSPLPHAWKALPRKSPPRSQQRVRRGSEPTPLRIQPAPMILFPKATALPSSRMPQRVHPLRPCPRQLLLPALPSAIRDLPPHRQRPHPLLPAKARTGAALQFRLYVSVQLAL